MISALRGFSESEPPPPDAASVKLTADYLDACNLIFERGILSRKMIKGVNSPVLENIKLKMASSSLLTGLKSTKRKVCNWI